MHRKYFCKVFYTFEEFFALWLRKNWGEGKKVHGGGGRGGEERKRLLANLRILKTLFTQKIAQRGIPPITGSHKSKKKIMKKDRKD